jgi:hypothetical protein
MWFFSDLGGYSVAAIPANLAPGNYLLRHEIIALHLGNLFQGAQFYVACIQLKVSGNGTGVPRSKDLVSLPGAYSDHDPGIYDQDVRLSRSLKVFFFCSCFS